MMLFKDIIFAIVETMKIYIYILLKEKRYKFRLYILGSCVDS